MDTYPTPPQKKGIGVLGWLGIGCGGIVVLVIIALVVGGAILTPKLKQLGEDFAKNPARATATTLVSVAHGQIEMAAEDDVNRRYTIRDKKTGELTTIYFDIRTQKPVTVKGDFSSIPAGATGPAPTATPAPTN